MKSLGILGSVSRYILGTPRSFCRIHNLNRLSARKEIERAKRTYHYDVIPKKLSEVPCNTIEFDREKGLCVC
jgi:hypothetical protein